MNNKKEEGLMRVIFAIFIIFSFVFSSFSQQIGRMEDRAEVYLVVVPVIVLDKEGNFVEGLKKEDFEIFEDGKRQEIETFYVERFSDGKLQIEGIERGEKLRKEFLGQRTIVIIFDTMITNPFHVSRLKEPLEKFLRDFLRKEDRLAVFIGGKSYIWWGGNFFSSSSDPVGEIIKKAMLGHFNRLDFDQRSFTNPGGEKMEDIEEQLLRIRKDTVNFQAIVYQMIFFQSLRRLHEIAMKLKMVEGEKKVVLLSEGYGFITSPQSKYWELQDPDILSKIFNDSNVTVYGLSLSGLKSDDYLPSQTMTLLERERTENLTGIGFKQAYLRQLSHDTGGISITNTNDMNEGLQLIGKAMSHSYVLGYTPENRIMDGKYRKIEVKVKRKGLEVRHRRGYFASDTIPEKYKELEDYLRKGDLKKAINLEVKEMDLSGRCKVFAINPKNPGAFPVSIEGGKEEKLYLSKVQILAQIEQGGKPIKKIEDEIFFDIREKEIQKRPSIYIISELKEGRYKIRILAKDMVREEIQFGEKEFEVGGREEELKLFFVNESGINRFTGDGSCLTEFEGRILYPEPGKEFSKKGMLPIYFEYSSKKEGEADIELKIYKGEEKLKSIRQKLTLKKGKNQSYISISLSELQEGEYTLEVILKEPEGKEYKRAEKFTVF
jgi:VWFA-related protein